jgi:hypothetical protein
MPLQQRLDRRTNFFYVFNYEHIFKLLSIALAGFSCKFTITLHHSLEMPSQYRHQCYYQ